MHALSENIIFMASAVAFAYIRDFSDVVLHFRFSKCAMFVACFLHKRAHVQISLRPSSTVLQARGRSTIVRRSGILYQQPDQSSGACKAKSFTVPHLAKHVQCTVCFRLRSRSLIRTSNNRNRRFFIVIAVLSVKLSASCSDGVPTKGPP